MKPIFYNLMLLAGLAAVSCAEIPQEAVIPEYDLLPGEILFSGSMETYPGTKSSAGPDGTVTWDSSDEIGVYDGTAYSKATVLSISGSRIVFKAEADASAENYIAVCPYDAVTDGTVTLSEGRISLDAVKSVQQRGRQTVSVASIDAGMTEDFTFRNVVNLLRFRISKAGVVKAVLTGNADESLAGVMSVDPATGEGEFLPGGRESLKITVDAVPGEDNCIAIAPDIRFEDGFTVTFYGDDECTDYLGEVNAPNALPAGRNKITDLGSLDGRIDNFKLWEAGKSIEIAGREYSKESTGLTAKLLSAVSGDIDLYTECNRKSGIFFLESAGDYGFVNSDIVNVGNLMLVSRYDAKRVTYTPSSTINPPYGLYLTGGADENLIIKGVRFDLTNSSAIRPFTSQMNSVNIDNCEIFIPDATKYFVIINNRQLLGPKDFTLVDSEITTTASTGLTRLIEFLYAHDNLGSWENIIVRNNIFYSRTNTQGFSLLYNNENAAEFVPEGGQGTVITLENNTFYNMMPHNNNFAGLYAYSLGGLTIRKNIFYNTNPAAGARRFAYITDKNSSFSPVIEDNIASSGLAMNWFNPNGYCPVAGTVSVASEIFSTADPDNVVFSPVNNYSDYGAQR